MSKVTLPSQRQDETVPLTEEKFEPIINTASKQQSRRSKYAYLAILALPILIITYFSVNFACSRHHMSHQSPASGWRQRATLHPNRASFVPTESSFKSGLIRSTRLHPRGLVVGLFAPDVAVDSAGHVLQLAKEDWSALDTLSHQATADNIPKAGGFRNQWRIKHPRTDYPISWLRASYGGGVREVSVYGLSTTTTELSHPVGGLTSLPDTLQEAFIIFDEGRSVEDDGQGDSALAKAVADIVSGTTED